MQVVQPQSHGFDVGHTVHLLTKSLDVISFESREITPFYISATKDIFGLSRALATKEGRLSAESDPSKSSKKDVCFVRMGAFRARRLANRNEQAEKQAEQMKRSKSLSEVRDTDLEEQKPQFSKSEKGNIRSNTTSEDPNQIREHSYATRSRTYSSQNVASSCLPRRSDVKNALPHSDSLASCIQVIDPGGSSVVSNTRSNVHDRRLEEFGQPLFTERATATQTGTGFYRKSLTMETRKRNSKILVTRLELEQAINKDDRNKLLSAIRCKTLDTDERDYYGKTLLHTACSVGNYHCAQILVGAGAKVNLQDHAGFTPLHCAVVSNHVPCAVVLITAGADISARTRTMHTALTLAHEDEMILFIGRTLLLQETISRKRVSKNDCRAIAGTLRETEL